MSFYLKLDTALVGLDSYLRDLPANSHKTRLIMLDRWTEATHVLVQVENLVNEHSVNYSIISFFSYHCKKSDFSAEVENQG